jgi:hypothetical protein
MKKKTKKYKKEIAVSILTFIIVWEIMPKFAPFFRNLITVVRAYIVL